MIITCQQFLEWMSDYLDGELEAVLAEAVRQHGEQCAPCQVVLDSSDQMLRLVGDDRLFAMPPGASERLHQALERGLGEPLVPAELRPPVPVATLQAPRRSHFILHSAWAAAAIVILVLAAGILRWRASATTTSGWLIDRHCLATFQSHLADHPRDCLIRCASSTYGLVDAKGHFRPFDAKGNQTALAAVKASTQPDHLWVTVKAKRSSSSELAVEQLELTEPGTDTVAAPTSR